MVGSTDTRLASSRLCCFVFCLLGTGFSHHGGWGSGRRERAGHRSQARHIPMLLFLSDNNCPVELVRAGGCAGIARDWERCLLVSALTGSQWPSCCSQLGPSSLSIDSGRLGPGHSGQTTGIQCCGPSAGPDRGHGACRARKQAREPGPELK